jgi:hypothetical protein
MWYPVLLVDLLAVGGQPQDDREGVRSVPDDNHRPRYQRGKCGTEWIGSAGMMSAGR